MKATVIGSLEYSKARRDAVFAPPIELAFFGGAGLSDPAVDCAGLYSTAGEAFLRRCQAAYPEIEAMMERVRFHFGTFALEEALFGIEHDDREAFNAGMENYV